MSFFFDRDAVTKAVDRGKRRALGRTGALIRKIARDGLKVGRMMSPEEMTPERRQLHAGWLEKGNGSLSRWQERFFRMPSEPGDRPFLHWEQSWLKSKLFFSFDPQTSSVVVGPQRFGDGVAGVLEHGGVDPYYGYNVFARPFMAPAEERARSTYVKFWENAIR